MVKNIIENIEEKIRANTSLTENNKTELLDLLAKLKPEIDEFSKAKAEHAESIAGFMSSSAHEVLRQEKNPTLLRLSIDGLFASVKGFEVSHPQLVETVNYIADVLAKMGI
ncbi:MAG: DUF4404 family protein [Bacteroidota bacterium]|nr:DUF4404 family protein [Bacteroidota bacterium]MDP4195915.1 DUF4404 family protein [Bacteroidota bacterium]